MTERPENGFANDDERLSALIDGEISADARQALEARLAAEPPLARRLDALRSVDRLVRDAYGPLASEPLSLSLTAVLHDDPVDMATGAVGPTDSGGDPAPILRAAPVLRFWISSAIVAAIALTVGISLSGRDDAIDIERMIASNALIESPLPLHEVLESIPSGETVNLDGDLRATPRLSFRAAGGGYCRELDLLSNAQLTAVIGCREAAGWRIKGGARLPATGDAGQGFAPASDSRNALDAVVDGLISGAPLGAEEELAAIAAGWR